MSKPTVRDLCDPAYTPPEVPRGIRAGMIGHYGVEADDQRRALDAIWEAVFDAALGALCQRADVLKQIRGRFHASSVAASAADAARAHLEKCR